MTTPPHDYSYPTAPSPNPVTDTIQQLSDQLFGGPTYPQTTYETDYTHHTVGSAAGSSSTFAPPTVGGSSDRYPEIQTIEEEPEASTPPGPRKRRNPRPKYNAHWWRYFEQTIDPATGKCVSARCKVKGCKSSFTYDDNNSSMGRHAARHISNGEQPQEQPDNTLVQTQINPDGTRTHQKYDEKKMLSEFARYITHKEQPISMSGCLSFARLVIRGCAQPFYKPFYYRKMSNEIKEQFTYRKNELIAIFATAPFKVALTSDIWTAGKHGLSYICVTAHYIDDNWKLQKRVLSFRIIEYPHTGEVVFNAILGVMNEFKLKNDLQNKVFSISFDNASNNGKAIEYFLRSLSPIANGAFFHQKCACHVLNLTVKAGLKTSGANDLITKFKKAVTHIFTNGIRKQRFHDMCSRMQFTKLRVPWDVDTRWNSTYRMLKRCFPYAHAINAILNETPEGMELALSSGEWDQLNKLMKFLEVFFKATLALSCSYKPTAHELLHHLLRISQVYHEMKGTFLISYFLSISVFLLISVLY
jgi:hypothetical protein